MRYFFSSFVPTLVFGRVSLPAETHFPNSFLFHQAMKSSVLGSLLLALLLTLGAFSCEKEELSENADWDELKRRETEIRAFVADRACAPDRTCGVIGFGAKPCGGPWSYLVYSLRTADVTVLTQKVDAYNQLERELNTKYGRGSDCALVTPPTVACQNGTCATTTP
jgi:hypothetical protein